MRNRPEFLARRIVVELEALSDHELEQAGRLTEPMRWNPETDRYKPVAWEEAFRHIGAELRSMAPDSVVFYTQSHTSNEAA